MTPSGPPAKPDPEVSVAQRAAITTALGPLPDDLLRAVRDARGLTFQRLEFLGDAVMELVVRFHAVVADGACDCAGDVDALVTDHALARAAKRAGLGAWLEWDASDERRADLVEASSGAVWLASGWVALAGFVGRVVHPLAPLTPEDVDRGWNGTLEPTMRRGREVLGASVLEVAAAHAAYLATDEAPGVLTGERNRRYATRHVVERAQRAGWPEGAATGTDHDALAHARDAVERRLADTVLARGIPAAVAEASDLIAE